jgi:hypothetical protein
MADETNHASKDIADAVAENSIIKIKPIGASRKMQQVLKKVLCNQPGLDYARLTG